MEVAKTTTISLDDSMLHESLQTHRQRIDRIDVLHDALKVEIEYTRKFLEQIHAYNSRPISVSGTNHHARIESPQPQEGKHNTLHSDGPHSGNRGKTSQNRPHHFFPPNPKTTTTNTTPITITTTNTANSHNHPPISPQQQQQASLPPSLKSCKCCQQRLASEERELRSLEKKVRGLEGRVKGFEEMPPDKEKALMEVEKMKRQLDGLMSKRNRLFKDLVKESGGLG